MDDMEISSGSDDNVSQAEIDWLVGDVQGRIGQAGGSNVGRETSQDDSLGDEDAEGEDDLEPEGEEDAGNGAGSSEEVEQSAMASIYSNGLFWSYSNHFKQPASGTDIVATVKSAWPLIEAYGQSDNPASLRIINDQLDILFDTPSNIRGSERVFQQARKSIMKVVNVIFTEPEEGPYMDKAREHFEELLKAISNVRSFPC
jgi:hypothetical protein